MRTASTLTLSLAALGLLAPANPAMAAVGARVRVLNSSGAPREVHLSVPHVQGTLSMDLIHPVSKEAGEGSILVDSESLEALGGRQMVVVLEGHEVELYLEHEADRARAELPFWVGDPSEGKAGTHYCAFQLRSDLGAGHPVASLRAGFVAMNSPICFETQLAPDLLVLIPKDAAPQSAVDAGTKALSEAVAELPESVAEPRKGDADPSKS